MQRLTKMETEMMDTLWKGGIPMCAGDLKSAPHSWKNQSLHILLNSLLEKKMIQPVGMLRCGKTYGRLFYPTVSREEYSAYAAASSTGTRCPDPVRLMAEILRVYSITQDNVPGILAQVRDAYDKRLQDSLTSGSIPLREDDPTRESGLLMEVEP